MATQKTILNQAKSQDNPIEIIQSIKKAYRKFFVEPEQRIGNIDPAELEDLDDNLFGSVDAST